MSTALINGGDLELWGGWRVSVPPCHHGRNTDGSWSAWGADWTLDVTIIEYSGTGTAPQHSDVESSPIKGEGWSGSCEVLKEQDNGREVTRFACTLYAQGTIASVWVSYLDPRQQLFARGLVSRVSHAHAS